MAKFQLYWRHGVHEEIEGRNIADAMNKHYSAGALAALDFYDPSERVSYTWNEKGREWNKNREGEGE
jgi:hypothetical protein